MFRRNLLASFCFVLVLGASPCFAAGTGEPGDIGIFADPAGTLTSVEMAPWVATNLYLVAFPGPNGLNAFEIGIDLPPMMVTAWRVIPPAPSQTALGNNSWIVTLRYCEPPGQAATLVELSVTTTAPVTDAVICVDRLTESSITTVGNGMPGFADCVVGDLHRFTPAQNGQGIYPDGCLVVNPTMAPPVSTESVRFSSLKARY